MFKKIWFQLHWLLGITAGLVLALVGLTGATLSFESDILRWLNPEVMTVSTQPNEPLPVAERIRLARAAMPEKTIIGITVDSAPGRADQVGFAGGRRGEWIYQNPYTGKLLGKPTRGEDVLHLMEDLHRRLAAGDTGKQIVGASTLMLLVLVLSGLYLRWPRRASDWCVWLTFSWARKGRSFLWDLHSVIGTWLLPLYLLAALTGLYWSYDWYRDGLFELTGAPRPTAPAGPMQAPADAKDDTTPQNSGLRDRDIEQIWQVFLREVPAGYLTATLRLPERSGEPVDIRYLDADPAHNRASNNLKVDAVSFAVQKHERYDALNSGSKLMRSMFALHSGSFFGLTGIILMMVASVLMPLFAITGWLLYLDRRGKKRAAKQAATLLEHEATRQGDLSAASVSNSTTEAAQPLLIAYASQTGFAEQLAWQSARLLQAAGLAVHVQPIARVDGAALAGVQQALFVVSTFGDGEAPDTARGFVQRVLTQSPSLQHLRYAVLALGDKQYQAFCGFGRTIDHWLRSHGARALFASVEVDKGDAAALGNWQQQLQVLTGVSPRINWGEQTFQQWQLKERRVLNPGSVGSPMFHLALSPLPTDQDAVSALTWRAGDLLDVLPQQSSNTANAMREALGLAADLRINGEPITQWLSRHECPSQHQMAAWRGLPLQVLVENMQPLQARTYSIASVPADGCVQLLVRQEQHADGSYGIGSGWLTAHLPVGATLMASVRQNAGFHCDDYRRPLILIGNGSGLSALRSHLRAAAEQGGKGHWLIFGERSQHTDFYYRSEIAAWQADGTLARVDLAFSRDQTQRVYVQDKLRENAQQLKSYIAAGAAIYVCGSAQGMAPAVEQTLLDILDNDTVTQLIEQGRYRRDVY